MKIREFNCPNCGKKVNTYGLCKDCDELIDRNPRYYYDIEGIDELIVASTYSGLMKKLIIQFKFYEKPYILKPVICIDMIKLRKLFFARLSQLCIELR